MAKKAKNPLRDGDQENSINSNVGSCFMTLFGEIPEQNAPSNSLFSENNPFRRKAQETRDSGHDSGLAFGGHGVEKYGSLANSDSSELKEKKKKRKERVKKESLGVEAELVEGENKKLKKGELKGMKHISDGNSLETKQILGLEDGHLTGPGERGDFGIENGKKKKKRKRDEVEAEYEAKRYGVHEEDENLKGSKVLVGKRKKMDNPEDTMVTREGFDDESKLLRTVFVGNLPLKIKKKELVKELGKFGEVESVRVRSVPIVDGKIPRKGAIIQKQFNEHASSVHAYVVFKTEESAEASLAHNMAMVGGNHIRVDRACPPRKKLKGDSSPLYDNKRTVFVGNLPFDVKDEEIYQLFSGLSNLESSIEAVRVVRDPGTSLGKGIAYVLLKTTDAANSILRLRNLKIRDRNLRVSKSSDTPLKRKNSITPETASRPSKKFAVINSRTPDSDGKNKVKTKEITSYQGVRASKTGSQKKMISYTRNSSPVRSKFPPSAEKSRKNKRPAVTARKEKAQNAARKSESKGGAGGPKLAGTKRKFGDRTPEIGGHKKKKVTKFR